MDGEQHFEQVSNWVSPEVTRANDIYKMKCVAGVHRIIRIDRREIVKNDDWKLLIDKAIQSTDQIIYISSDTNLYNEHKRLFAEKST